MAERLSALDLCSDGLVVRNVGLNPDRGTYVLQQDTLP